MGRLTVAVRVRPPVCEPELDSNVATSSPQKTTVNVTGDNVILNEATPKHGIFQKVFRSRQFKFDQCFDSAKSQEEIFQILGATVLDSLLVVGQNCSVVAYGQTGSGKTFTMLGEPSQPGFIPQFCNYLIDSQANCSVSFYEIYNEKVFDLLSDCRKALSVRQHPSDGPFVLGLQRQALKSSDDLIRLLQIGIESRTTAKTASHHSSSRSHAVFTIYLNEDKGPKLHLVDLAGSERPHHHASKLEIRESAHINRSLATLGNVILCLSCTSSARNGSKFAPYRDSALTWLLRDSLGGRAQTVMIATISPEARFYNETLKTLRYANRARSIFSHTGDGENRGGRHGVDDAIEAELRREIDRLRVALADRLNHHRPPELDHRFKVCHCIRNAEGQPYVVRYDSNTRSCMTSPLPVVHSDDVPVIKRSKSVALSPIMDQSPRDGMDDNHNSSSESTSVWDGESPRVLDDSARGVLPSPVSRNRQYLLADESDFTKSGSFFSLDYSMGREELAKGQKNFTMSLNNTPLTSKRKLEPADDEWTKSFPEAQLRRSKINLNASASRLSPYEPDRPKFAFLRRSFRRQYLRRKRKSSAEPVEREAGKNVPDNLEKMDKISLSSALDSPLPNRRAANMQVSIMSLESSATASSSFFDPQSTVADRRDNESGKLESGGSLKKKLRKRAEEKRSKISASSSSSSQSSTRSNSPVHLPSIHRRASNGDHQLSLSYSMDMLKRAKLLAKDEHGGGSDDDDVASIPSFDGDSIEPSSDQGEFQTSAIGIASLENSTPSLRRDSGFLASSLLYDSTKRDDDESIPEDIAEEIVRDIFTETRLNVAIESDSLLSGNSFHSPSVSKSPDSLDDSGGRALAAPATAFADEGISPSQPLQQREHYYDRQEVSTDNVKEADIVAMGEKSESPSRVAKLIGTERKHKLLTRSSATDLTGVQHHRVIRRQLSHGDSDGVDVNWTESLPKIMEINSPVPGLHDSQPSFAQLFYPRYDPSGKDDLPTEPSGEEVIAENIEGQLSHEDDSLNEPTRKTIRLSVSSIEKGDDDVAGEHSSDSRSPQIDRRRLSAISDIPDERMDSESWANMMKSWTNAQSNRNDANSPHAHASLLSPSQRGSEEFAPPLLLSKSIEIGDGNSVAAPYDLEEDNGTESNYLLLEDGKKTPLTPKTPLKDTFNEIKDIFPNRGSRSSTRTDLFASMSSEASHKIGQLFTEKFGGKFNEDFVVVRELPAQEGIDETNLLELLSDSSRTSSRKMSVHEGQPDTITNKEDLLSDFDPFGARRASEPHGAHETAEVSSGTAATHEADLVELGLTANDFLRQAASPSPLSDEEDISSKNSPSKRHNMEQAEQTELANTPEAKGASRASALRDANDELESTDESTLPSPRALVRSRELEEMDESVKEEPTEKSFITPFSPSADNDDILVLQPKERMYYELTTDSKTNDSTKEVTHDEHDQQLNEEGESIASEERLASDQGGNIVEEINSVPIVEQPADGDEEDGHQDDLQKHAEINEDSSLNIEELVEKEMNEDSSTDLVSKTTMNAGVSTSSSEHSAPSNVLKERNAQNEEERGEANRASFMYGLEDSSSASESDDKDTATPLPLIRPHEIKPSSSEETEEEVGAQSAQANGSKDDAQRISDSESIDEVEKAKESSKIIAKNTESDETREAHHISPIHGASEAVAGISEEEDKDFASSPLRDSVNSSKRSFKRDFDASSDDGVTEENKQTAEYDRSLNSSGSKYSADEVHKHTVTILPETSVEGAAVPTILPSATETQFKSKVHRTAMYEASSDDEFSVEFNPESDADSIRGKKSVSSIDRKDSALFAAVEDAAQGQGPEVVQPFASKQKDPTDEFSSEEDITIPPVPVHESIGDLSGRGIFNAEQSDELSRLKEQQDDVGFRGFEEALLRDRIAEVMSETDADEAGNDVEMRAPNSASAHIAAETDGETEVVTSGAEGLAETPVAILSSDDSIVPDAKEHANADARLEKSEQSKNDTAEKEIALEPAEEFDDEKSPAALVASQVHSSDEGSDFEQVGRKRSIQEELMLAELHSSPKKVVQVDDVPGVDESADKYAPDFDPESSSTSLKALDESTKVERVQGAWNSDESSGDDDDFAGSEPSSISSKGRKRVSWLEGADVAYIAKQEEDKEESSMPSFYQVAERLKKSFHVQRVEEGAPEYEKQGKNPFLEEIGSSGLQFEPTNPFIRDLTESEPLPVIHERENTEDSEEGGEKSAKSGEKYSSSSGGGSASSASSRSTSTSTSYEQNKISENNDDEKDVGASEDAIGSANDAAMVDDVIPGEIERQIETYGSSSSSAVGSTHYSPVTSITDPFSSYIPSSSANRDEVFNEKDDLDPFGQIGVTRMSVRKKIDSFYDSFDIDEDTEEGGVEDSTLDRLMRSHARELRNEERLEEELESRMNLPGAIEEEDEDEEEEEDKEDSDRSTEEAPDSGDWPDSFDLGDGDEPKKKEKLKEEKIPAVPESIPPSSDDAQIALEHTHAGQQSSKDSSEQKPSGSFAEFVNNMVHDIDESTREELSKITDREESPSSLRSPISSPPDNAQSVKEAEEQKKAMRNLYGMLLKSEEGEAIDEEVLNVTVVDGVPYITMEPTSSWNDTIEVLDLNPDTVEHYEAVEEKKKHDTNFEEVTAEASKEFSFERPEDQAEGIAQLVYDEISLDSSTIVADADVKTDNSDDDQSKVDETANELREGSVDQSQLRANLPSLPIGASFASEEDRRNVPLSISFPPMRSRRSFEADSLRTDQILASSNVPPNLNFDPMQVFFVEQLDHSDIRHIHPDHELDESEDDDDGFDLTDEEFVYEKDDSSLNPNASPRKSVSWSDFRGHNLEAGPSLLFNGDQSTPIKPILKNSPRVSLEYDSDFFVRMQRSASESRLVDSGCQTDISGPIAEHKERTYSIASLDEQPSPSSTASMRSVLRYNATRLFKDLRMLVLERDRTIEALETVKSAEQAGFVSLATKHHQQHFRDRLIESRVALDVRIDDVWYKLKNEDLKALSPGQKEWLFGCMTSTGLTFSDRRAEPPMRASPSPSSRWRFNSDYVHHDNGIRADDFSEACTHSLFDYPRKLAKLRQAFIGAVHEDTVEMLAANQAIENRTADWVYRSSNEDVAREFNRLAAALVDRVVPESSQRRSQSANSDRVDAEIIRMRRSLAQSYY